jgi:hypothetical protein
MPSPSIKDTRDLLQRYASAQSSFIWSSSLIQENLQVLRYEVEDFARRNGIEPLSMSRGM